MIQKNYPDRLQNKKGINEQQTRMNHFHTPAIKNIHRRR
jgi:hypothetical protein